MMVDLNGAPADKNATTETILQRNAAFATPEDCGQKVPMDQIGEFKLIREIGRGGMGVVYEAFQPSLNRTVALKILPLNGRIDQRQILRFQNEATAAAQLHHPNIVPVYSVGVDAGAHYYAMQRVIGKDLAKVIRFARDLVDSKCVRPSGETPLLRGTTAPVLEVKADEEIPGPPSGTASDGALDAPPHSFLKLIDSLITRKSKVASPIAFEPLILIGIQAAEALHHAHELGIVHRDIKPSNLLLDDDGKLWIADFGLAHVQGAAAMTMTGEIVGTLRYMSPEQPLGKRVLVDQRTDIYSLGITLYELLTLSKAFAGETPKEIIKQVCFDNPAPLRRQNPMVPQDLETIILKAIAKNPADRYQTAGELAEDLRRFLNDQPILARRPTVAQQCRRWIRRHAMLTTSVAISIVVLLFTSLTASAVIWNSLNAETQQRKRAESLLNKSEGLRLAANSVLQLESNPGLAMLLAVRSSELTTGVDSGTALLQALSANHELRTFAPREQTTDRLSISPDGSRIVSTSAKWQVTDAPRSAIVSDLSSGETFLTLDSDFSATSAAYSPDGKFILTASQILEPRREAQENVASSGSPELWNALTGTREFGFGESILYEASPSSFSPASDRIALLGSDHTVRIYSTQDGRLNVALPGHSSRVTAAKFSPDGQRLVSVGDDKTVRVWDAVNGTEIRVFNQETAQPQTLTAAFVGDSQTVIISANTGTSLMSVETGQQINQQHWHETKSVVSHDGRMIALMYPFGEHVKIRRRHSGEFVSEFTSASAVTSAVFSPDGQLLLVTTFANAAIYDTNDGTLVATLNGHTELVSHGEFTNDGTTVATTSDDGTVRVWRVKSGLEQMTFELQPAQQTPFPFTVSEDSSLMAVATDATYRAELKGMDGLTIGSGLPGRISDARCQTDHLVTVTDQEVHVWHAATSRRIASFPTGKKQVRSAVAVPNSPLVVVLIEGGPTYVWNTDDGESRIVGDPHVSALHCDPHPTDGRIALSLQDGRCVVVNAESGVLQQQLKHDGQVLAVTFSNDGTKLLTVDDRNTAHIWQGKEFDEVRSIRSPEAEFSRAIFSGDDSSIVTWSALQTAAIRAWNTEDGMQIAETPPLENPRVAIHETRPLAAISSNAGVFLWDWTSNTQQQVTMDSGKCSVFLGEKLLSLEQSGRKPSEELVPAAVGVPGFIPWVLNVRDVTTGNSISTSPITTEPWNLSADRKSQLAVLSFRTHDVAVMEMATKKKRTIAGRHAAPIIFQGFSDGNRSVVCVSKDQTASVWNMAGQRLHVLQGHEHEIVAATLSPDSRQLVTFDATGRGIQWDVLSGRQVREFAGHAGPVQTAQFSASGRQLLTAGVDKTARLWDLIGRTESEFRFESSVLSADLSADEQQLLIIEGSDLTNLHNLAGAAQQNKPSQATVIHTRTSHRSLIQTESLPRLGRIRPDGRQVAILMQDETVRLFDTGTRKLISQFDPNRRLIQNFAFSPDSHELLVMHTDELSLWDLESGAEQLRIPHPDGFWISSRFAEWRPFSPDGKWIITSTDRIRKWPQNPLEEALQRTPRTISKNEIRQFSVNLLTNE
ncbi:MAG TPA: serine/threonine-protein kinase [Planctomycetaceae bacterium]|mgnify:CR=1 FL=1|nr:serine/threonine-protein kinase [Planctomycetaceae bacterium]